MKRRIFLFAGLFLLISLITGGVFFLKQTAHLSSDESMVMIHPSDYQEQG
ncbi:MAG: hypothetical protein JXR50_01690 [Prolixibacteraceae bacterium]|nr:hypothetical protein [Prolixibacteraceae bacterium]MBN2648433.1 hypothetical protein [Prolixibacteraceae bacterium]